MRRSGVALLLALALVAGGCDSDPAPQPTRTIPGPSTGPSVSNTASSSAPGGEGQTGNGPPCPITSNAAVAKAFGGPVLSSSLRRSGIGSPLCTFRLSSSNVDATGTVTLTSDTAASSSASATTFARLRRQSPGAVDVSGVGAGAFYLPATTTISFRQGTTTIVLQAVFATRAGTKFASVIKRDIVALATVTARDL